MDGHSARTYPCPACLVEADLVRGCPGCGRPPDPLAAEVVGLNTTIAVLTEREQRCLGELAVIRQELAETRARRDSLAMQVRARTLLGAAAPASPDQPAPAGPPGSAAALPEGAAPSGTAAPPPPRPAAAAGAEVSGYGVQTLLFVIGGLLLGTGAVVFMVVAWTRFGLAGQALTLVLATTLALAAPPLARWRRLPGTAETLAVLGILMLLLDGYALWRAGLVAALPAATWAGSATGATALIALGYGRWATLASPRFAALVLAQPVLPLLAVEPLRALPDAVQVLAALGYLLAVLAGANLLLCGRLLTGALRVVGWVAAGAALVTGVGCATVALIGAARLLPAALAGGAVLAGVAAGALLARVTRSPAWASVVAVAAVLAVPLTVGRLTVLAWPGYALLAVAGTVAAVALAVPVTGAGALRRGHRIGSLVATGALGAYAGALTLWAAAVVAWEAPRMPAALEVSGPYGWQLPAALVLLAVALMALLPPVRPEIGAGAVALIALSLPAALALPWWAPVLVALVAAAATALPAARAGSGRRALPALAVAVVLAGYALLVGRASATALAAALAAVVVISLVVAVRAWPGRVVAAASVWHRTVAGGVALATGLVALPCAVAAGVVAGGGPDQWPGRGALAATGLLLGAVALLRYAVPARPAPVEPPGHAVSPAAEGSTARAGQPAPARAPAPPRDPATVYLAAAAGAVHVVTPVAVLAGLVEGGLAMATYAGVALLLLSVLGLLRPPADAGRWLLPRAPLAAVMAVLAAPSLGALLLAPYGWLDQVWSGRPTGTGLLAPGWGPYPGSVLDSGVSGAPLAAGMLLLSPAAALAGRAVAGRWSAARAAALPFAPPALLVGLAWLAAPWPVIPVTSLLLGGIVLAWAGLKASRGWAAGATVYGLALAGAGLAGMLPMRGSTLAGLGFALVVAAVVAVAGRSVPARVAGWVAASAAGVLLAIAATRAAEAPPALTAFALLGVAAVGLAASVVVARGRPERAAAEASAHASAVVALLLLLPSPGQAAVVAVLWGVALAVRALRRGEPATARLARLLAAGGSQLLAWWLLLISVGAEVVEAYTLPAAGLALAAGAWARRGRPHLSSWVAYGAGLAAALLPSLALTLADPMPLRRLLLGLGAVAVLLAGARARLRAPVVAGGVLAGLLAVRELALVWQRLDAWIPLTLAGLLLVGLAATYERRRRDLTRLRAALRQMA